MIMPSDVSGPPLCPSWTPRRRPPGHPRCGYRGLVIDAAKLKAEIITGKSDVPDVQHSILRLVNGDIGRVNFGSDTILGWPASGANSRLDFLADERVQERPAGQRLRSV